MVDLADAFAGIVGFAVALWPVFGRHRGVFAIWLACGGLSDACRRPSHFLFAGPKRSNPEKWPDATRWGYKHARSRFVC